MRLGTYLEHRYNEQRGDSRMVDPLDAAALKAFCVHSRALCESLWRDRRPREGVKQRKRLQVRVLRGGCPR
jgi:hypothetical protein